MQRRASHQHRAISAGPCGLRDLSVALPEETPVALVYNGSTLAVMMASPSDLMDFALGFTLSESLVERIEDIGEIEIVEHPQGVELRMWLPQDRADAIDARRRAMAGPVGCGLCGIDSLDQALRPLPQVGRDALRLRGSDVRAATQGLRAKQPLHDETHAVHAAGFYRPGEGIIAVREDVGRHNALDKLVGALARDGIDPASGALVLTSRVSSEMVQKAVALGVQVVIAVSAPTALGMRLAEEAGLTLVTRARGDSFNLITHAHRIEMGEPQ